MFDPQFHLRMSLFLRQINPQKSAKLELSDPMLFTIPEAPFLFCTQSVRQAVLDAGLKGFWFQHYTKLYR